MKRFKLNDVVRCKKKYSPLYPRANVNALCKVSRVTDTDMPLNISTAYDKRTRSFVRVRYDIYVKILSHRTDKGLVGRVERAQAFHFRKKNKKDEKGFVFHEL